jgi:F-type H+-transporting ATPase subunit delta
MANEELARSYAQAIFEQAVDRWRKALRGVSESVARAVILTQLDNPAEKFERKKQLLNPVFPENTDPELRNLIYLLASKNQVHLLPEVLVEFDRYVERGPTRQLVQVTSAIPLNEAERTQLEQKIRAQYGPDLDLDYRVDPSLLGGLRVRIGDRVIDGTVVGRLNAMRQRLEATR